MQRVLNALGLFLRLALVKVAGHLRQRVDLRMLRLGGVQECSEAGQVPVESRLPRSHLHRKFGRSEPAGREAWQLAYDFLHTRPSVCASRETAAGPPVADGYTQMRFKSAKQGLSYPGG